MGKLKEAQIIFHVDESYTGIYDYFTKRQDNAPGIEIKYLFLLTVTIGFNNSKRKEMNSRGSTQMRSSYLSPDQESLVYNIAFSDGNFNNDIEKLASGEKSNLADIKKMYEEYANGGMEILIEKVFKGRWNGEELDPEYEHYHYDLFKFVSSEIKEVPF